MKHDAQVVTEASPSFEPMRSNTVVSETSRPATGNSRRPVLIPHKDAQAMLGVRPTCYWTKYVRQGLVKVVKPGPGCRSMAVYDSVVAVGGAPTSDR
jgi:hypothetical protein